MKLIFLDKFNIFRAVFFLLNIVAQLLEIIAKVFYSNNSSKGHKYNFYQDFKNETFEYVKHSEIYSIEHFNY